MSVLFTTKLWAGDWQKILSGGYERKHEACLYPFDKKWLLINNVDDDFSIEAARQATDADLVIVTEEYANEALKFFGLERKDMGPAYYYSICELVELYLAKDFDYLCHFASDTLLSNPYDWITPSIELMENDPFVITTAPNSEDSIAYGLRNRFFSDQAYLLKVDEWRHHGAFSYLSPKLPEYPPRAGDALFERRAGRFLHNSGKFRMLMKEIWYGHPSY